MAVASPGPARRHGAPSDGALRASYDIRVEEAATASDLVVWLMGAGTADARGLLSPTTIQGVITFSGRLPADAAGPAPASLATASSATRTRRRAARARRRHPDRLGPAGPGSLQPAESG